MSAKDEYWRYQNSGVVSTNDAVASDKPPLPRLVGIGENNKKRQKEEARARKFGKIAFWLAVVLIAPVFLISVGILVSLNVKTFRWFGYRSPFLTTVGVLHSICLIAFFISILGRKTKDGRRARWLSLMGFLMPFLVIWGIPWLLSTVGIHIRYE